MEYDLPTDHGNKSRLYITPQLGHPHFLWCFFIILFPTQAPLSPFWEWDINKVILSICPITDMWIIPTTWGFDENEVLCATMVWATINFLCLDGQFEGRKHTFITDFFLFKMNTGDCPLEKGKVPLFRPFSSICKPGRSNSKQSSLLGSGLDFSTEDQLWHVS